MYSNKWVRLKVDFLNFYFLNTDISFSTHNSCMQFWEAIQNILNEWSLSQNFDLSFNSILIL